VPGSSGGVAAAANPPHNSNLARTVAPGLVSEQHFFARSDDLSQNENNAGSALFPSIAK
jgi:hypothetical protein